MEIRRKLRTRWSARTTSCDAVGIDGELADRARSHFVRYRSVTNFGFERIGIMVATESDRVDVNAFFFWRFLIILAAFLALTFLSWPTLMSFDLWVMKDRGIFLNLDYLLAEHHSLGVDAYYTYGLLPVALQHALFGAFGRGYGPLIGCTIVVLFLFAAIWAAIVTIPELRSYWYLAIVVLLSPILLWVNPNFPYSIVQLSLLGAVLLLLHRRIEYALTAAAIGWWSVPSLPVLVSVVLTILIVADTRLNRDGSLKTILRRLAPAACTFVAIGIYLATEFGTRSVLATVLPVQGVAFYHAAHFGLGSLKWFLEPHDPNPWRYIGDRPIWWIVSNALLFGLGIRAIVTLARRRVLTPIPTAVMLCALIQFVFVTVAYGAAGQHIIYDPILALGVILGLSTIANPRRRWIAVLTFTFFGTTGSITQSVDTWALWRDTTRTSVTTGLYARQDWLPEWNRLLEISSSRSTLLLSYGTGVHHYFPTIISPDLAVLYRGTLLPGDRQRLVGQLGRADVIAEDMTGPTEFIDTDSDIQNSLKALCPYQPGLYFRFWKKCT